MKQIRYQGRNYIQSSQEGLSGICKGCAFDGRDTACKSFSDNCSPKKDGNMLILKLKPLE